MNMLLRIIRTALCIASFGASAVATTYYVDPAGSNGNDGLSPQTPWRTLLKIGVSTFQPGDQILFKRDGVWNEWLTPPSSGTAGNLIKFDAYGNGRPPEFTGYYATTSAQWTNISGDVWQIALSATQPISQLNFVRFGTMWGNSQSAQNLMAHDRDWYYDPVAQNLYVWSASGNPVAHYGSVTPMTLSGQSLININGVSYIEIQHIKLDWYDGYGVQVQGASDHIWLANLMADSKVPNATVPIGFYVHATGTPGDIHLYNTDAHRNYVGYRFDGTPSAIELKNCRAYANRTYGLMDNTGAVTYSYCHFYANNLATGISTDITGTPGPIDGGNNLAPDTPPNVRGFLQYPARITVTFDDPGLLDGPPEYIAPLLPMFRAKGVPLSIAVVTGYNFSQQLVSTFQAWINGGWDLNCHSVSHQYFVYLNGFTIQYTGTTASSVTLSIANKQLTITAPGDANAQVSWNLTAAAPGQTSTGLDTMGGIVATLTQRGVFSVTVDPNMKTAVKSEDLADVTAQDIKSSPYLLLMDKTRLMTDEMNWAKAWMNANLTGIGGGHSTTLTWAIESGVTSYNVYRSATSGGPYTEIASGLSSPTYVDYAVNPQQVWYYVVTGVNGSSESGYSNEVSATIPGSWVYVYPGSYEDTSTEAIAVSAGFAGSRGSGTMQPSPNAGTVLASGVDVQNILSQGMVPYFQGLTDQQFANKFRAMVFKSAVWGVPFGIFWHWNELTPSQVGLMLDTLKSSGATLMTNTQLVNYLQGTQQNAGTTYYADSSSGQDIDVRPTQTSPVVDQGGALTSEYKFDLMGIDQTQFGTGWEMGSFAFVPEYLGEAK
jgi:Polysaccharide deacetylase